MSVPRRSVPVLPCFITVCNSMALSTLEYDFVPRCRQQNDDGPTTPIPSTAATPTCRIACGGYFGVPIRACRAASRYRTTP